MCPEYAVVRAGFCSVQNRSLQLFFSNIRAGQHRPSNHVSAHSNEHNKETQSTDDVAAHQHRSSGRIHHLVLARAQLRRDTARSDWVRRIHSGFIVRHSSAVYVSLFVVGIIR